jgi:hypothetical protein
METILNLFSFFHFFLSVFINLLFPSYLLGYFIFKKMSFNICIFIFVGVHSQLGAQKDCFVFKIILNFNFWLNFTIGITYKL